MEAYLQSDDYKKLMETLSKAEDEDEYKNDTDPQGFFMYKKLVWICKRAIFIYCTG